MSAVPVTGSEPDSGSVAELDAVVVGAGFAGIYMLHRFKTLGFSVRAFESGSEAGGTWYWNGYPGARCDVESMEYSFQFSDELQQSWEWSERYATQPEILRYINHVVDRFELRGDIQFNTEIAAAVYDEAVERWLLTTRDGKRISARYCVMATGPLSTTSVPPFKGLDSFAGGTYHTGNWPQAGVDFAGKRVAVIGTGSSGIQCIPLIAEEAARLTVFQRTANYSAPAHNKMLAQDAREQVKADYANFRAANKQMPGGFGAGHPYTGLAGADLPDEEKTRILEERWAYGGLHFFGCFTDLMVDKAVNEFAADFIRDKIRARVDDPEKAELLCPKQTLGCKRLATDTGYYQTFNRPNVDLVDLKRDAISEILPQGIKLESGNIIELDAIVFATGFDALTGTLFKMNITGRDGRTLNEKWADGAFSYLGIAMAGFPNLFITNGPGSPSIWSNMVQSLEQHIDLITDTISYAVERDRRVIEADPAQEQQWLSRVNEIVEPALYYSCDSWYLGSNIPGKPRVFTAYLGFPDYLDQCARIVADDFRGFHFR